MYNMTPERQAQMLSTYGLPWCHDGISISNLQLQTPLNYGTDAWGREKEQPVLLSVRLSLKSSFETAAENDALDASTMHYGILAKALREMQPTTKWQKLDALSTKVYSIVGASLPDSELMKSLEVEIKLPKASLLGEAVVLHSHLAPAAPAQHTLHLVNICLPTLIGVNDNERETAQKLVINLWLMGLTNTSIYSYVDLEKSLVEVCDSIHSSTSIHILTVMQIINKTEYETLESLALHVLRELTKIYKPLQKPNSGLSIRLSLAKPQAISFADAPAIEVYRTAEQLTASINGKNSNGQVKRKRTNSDTS